MKWASHTAPSRKGEPSSGQSRAGLTKQRAKRLTGNKKGKRRQPSLTVAVGWTRGKETVPYVKDTPAFRERMAELDRYAETLAPGEYGTFEKTPAFPEGQVQIIRGIPPGSEK